MGREVGGGFRMGNMCTPVADSCQYMENQSYIVKSEQQGLAPGLKWTLAEGRVVSGWMV